MEQMCERDERQEGDSTERGVLLERLVDMLTEENVFHEGREVPLPLMSDSEQQWVQDTVRTRTHDLIMQARSGWL